MALVRNPFIATSAHDGIDSSLTTLGGSCYRFDKSFTPNKVLTDTLINDNLTNIICFDSPPIINNPVLDFPWTPPPPISTGCYPIRARAQTISDEDMPEGLTATFNKDESADKCFPILDLQLNLHAISQSIIGSMFGGTTTNMGGVLAPKIGCCCDEFGSSYKGDNECYSGRMSDCIGTVMPYQRYNSVTPGGMPNACVTNPTDSLSGGAQGGMGIKWIESDPNCLTCDPGVGGNRGTCCEYVRRKFATPQILGVGVITSAVSDGVQLNDAGRDATTGQPNTPLGTPYYVDVHLSTPALGKGLKEEYDATEEEWVPVDTQRVQVYNLNERISVSDNENMWPGRCDRDLDATGLPVYDDIANYIPNIESKFENNDYPDTFYPQRLCNGMTVTVMAVTLKGLEDSNFTRPFHDITDHGDGTWDPVYDNSVPWVPSGCLGGDLGNADDPNYALQLYVDILNAHDGTCT